MIKGFERGVFIYHTSMTAPFDDLCLHLQDCCGGCPYCVELCQRVVDEANAITAVQTQKAAGLTALEKYYAGSAQTPNPFSATAIGGKSWSEYMRTEGYKEYEECNCTHAAPYCNDCPVCTRNHQRAILARVERESTSYADVSRSWFGDFMRWLSRRYLQRVPD